jgi:O-acetyl-ADP-ribose deacetylase (regulator of RNase III)
MHVHHLVPPTLCRIVAAADFIREYVSRNARGDLSRSTEISHAGWTVTSDPRVVLHRGDITALAVDAIVNAANSSLLGGGGVDGAIHDAAGPELLQECRTLGGCPTGEARISRGYRLRARHVIHAVGPVWRGGTAGEDRLLASCYRSALSLAVEHELRSIAFPAISTGIYRFPLDRAAAIAVGEVQRFLAQDRQLERIVFCCFDAATMAHYRRALALD